MAYLAPYFRPKFTDDNNQPIAGGLIYTYQAGTSTPRATYTDASGSTPNTNPVVLDANGEAEIWITAGASYKFVIKDADDVEIKTIDNVSVPGGASNVPSGGAAGAVLTKVTSDDGDFEWITPTGETSASNVSVAASGNLTSTNAQDALVELQTDIDTRATIAALGAHAANTSNPHSVTKSQVGLGSVDNTSDLDKPISTAQQAAFDLKVDISTLTTKGDLLARTSSALARLGVGSDGQFLKADSSQSTGLIWATPGASSATLAITSKTANYTAQITDDVILCSSAAFTITLYAASGNAGKVLRIEKTDSSLSNIITIDANGSETIDGSLTKTLNTQGENYTLLCDGTNWIVIDHTIPNVTINLGTMTIGGVTAAPTKGATTVDKVQLTRNGRWGIYTFNLNQTAGSPGTGDYLFGLGGLQADTSIYPAYSTAGQLCIVPAAQASRLDTKGVCCNTSTTTGEMHAYLYSATQFRLNLQFSGSAPNMSNSSGFNLGIALALSFTVRVPISGWGE